MMILLWDVITGVMFQVVVLHCVALRRSWLSFPFCVILLLTDTWLVGHHLFSFHRRHLGAIVRGWSFGAAAGSADLRGAGREGASGVCARIVPAWQAQEKGGW